MLNAEANTQPIMLSDWRLLTSEEIWAAEEATGLDAHCVNALLVNGKGSIECFARDTIDALTTDAQKSVLNGESLTDMAYVLFQRYKCCSVCIDYYYYRCLPATNVISEGDFPHNYSAVPDTLFSGCQPSQGPTEVFQVDPSTGYVSWDLISAAGLAEFGFSIDQHPMYVYAVDGRYIKPMRVEAIGISSGTRYSVLVKLDQPAGNYSIRLVNHGVNQIINTTAILSYTTQNQAQATSSQPYIDVVGNVVEADASYLNETQVIPFPSITPSNSVSETFILKINHYNASYLWTLGNSSFALHLEDSQPLLFNTSSIPSDLTILTTNGTWIDLILSVEQPLQPPHPIHKHSNKYFVIGQGNGLWNYSSVAEAMQYIPESFNLVNPPIRDTFVTPAAGTGATWLAVRYQVVNPGAFLLHCHVQTHLSGGMALAILDGVDVWPVVPGEYQYGNNGF